MPPFWIGAQIMGGLLAVGLIAAGSSLLATAVGAVVGPLLGWFLWLGLRRRAVR